MESSKDKQKQDDIEDIKSESETDHIDSEKLQCRFYRKDFPDENDLVIVKCNSNYYRFKPQSFTRMVLMSNCLSTKTWKDLYCQLK